MKKKLFLAYYPRFPQNFSQFASAVWQALANIYKRKAFLYRLFKAKIDWLDCKIMYGVSKYECVDFLQIFFR